MRMHADEAEIDEGLVRRLLAGQFPEWAGLPVEEIPSSGTVNAMYRVGALTVRLPRIVGGVEDIEKEYEWLQRLGPLLPVEVPSPLGQGKPAEGYPWPWSIYRWIDGVVPDSGSASASLAGDLAAVVRAMRQIELPDGPAAYRGGPLETQDAETRAALSELEGLIDTRLALAAWEDALAAEPGTSSVWVHADLMPSNLLTRDGRLAAVIDFATAGLGDPACDLIPAWNLFTAETRTTYREALDIDDATWTRGRGRALSMSLIQLPYYRHTNKGIAATAQYTIDQALSDFLDLS